VFRTTTATRLDANGDAILDDGEAIQARVVIEDGKLRRATCRCKGEICDCSAPRNDAEQRDDAVEAYARAIEDAEHAGRNMWRRDLDEDELEAIVRGMEGR
jgi:hypothetical protein